MRLDVGVFESDEERDGDFVDVGDGDDVGDPVLVSVGRADTVAVGEPLGVSVSLLVSDGDAPREMDDVGVAEFEPVAVEVGVIVFEGVADDVVDGVGVPVDEGVFVCDGVCDGVGLAVRVDVALEDAVDDESADVLGAALAEGSTLVVALRETELAPDAELSIEREDTAVGVPLGNDDDDVDAHIDKLASVLGDALVERDGERLLPALIVPDTLALGVVVNEVLAIPVIDGDPDDDIKGENDDDGDVTADRLKVRDATAERDAEALELTDFEFDIDGVALPLLEPDVVTRPLAE